MPSVRAIRMHYNTVYLLEVGGSRVLIDTGPDYRGAWGEITAALGGRLPDLVVATHGHIDHASLGAAWRHAGVPVVVGAADHGLVTIPALHRPGELEALAAFAASCGAPYETAGQMVDALRRRFQSSAGAASEAAYDVANDRWPTALRFVPFQPDAGVPDRLPATVEALSCPGHTPGNLVVVEQSEGWLFSGDQLLPGMMPTPALQCGSGTEGQDWRFRSLPAFVDSLQRLARRSFSQCFPGHGDAFDGVAVAIARNLALIESRTEKVERALRHHGPLTPWSVCEMLYRLAAQRRPWPILSTIQGHLDLLEGRGQAHLTDAGWLAT